MSRPDTQRRDDLLVVALACGASVENAAQSAGYSERTVRRRLADPEFQARLRQLRADMVQRTAGMLTTAEGGAVRTLIALQAEGIPPPVRLAAARTALELGLPGREQTDLKPRLADLRELEACAAQAGPAEADDPETGGEVTESQPVAAPKNPEQARRDEQLLGALACGAGVEQAARRAKCHEKTVRRLLADPVFQRRLHQVRGDMAERAAAMLTAAALESVKTLIALTADVMPPRVRWGAAHAILELAPRFRYRVELEQGLKDFEAEVHSYPIAA